MSEIELIRRHYGDFTGLYDPGQAVAHVKVLLAEVQRLTGVIERGKRPSIYNDRLAELAAELERAKPVLDAAQAWREALRQSTDECRCHARLAPAAARSWDHAQLCPAFLGHADAALAAAVDGWKNPTPDEPDDEERVCAIVGCDEQAEAWGVCGEHMPGGPAHLAAEGLSSTDTTEAGRD